MGFNLGVHFPKFSAPLEAKLYVISKNIIIRVVHALQETPKSVSLCLTATAPVALSCRL